MSTSSVHTAYSLKPSEEKLVARAIRCLEKRLRYNAETITSTESSLSFTRLHLANEKNEVFCALFLDGKNRLLAFEKLFQGTINEATVHPRLIVQKALEYNAAAVIFAHNHPSGDPNPSSADIELTKCLQKILVVISVRVLDHIIVARENSYSFSANGLM